jgi:hypothetical protein
MTSLIPSQCPACLNLRAVGYQCDAFPAGIPAAMLTGGGDHREPLDGDHGKRFEQANTPSAREAFDQWERTFGSS